MSVRIHSLHVYPIKSCQGIDYTSAELTDTGFKYDRHWMLIDKEGNFLSQRQYPAMARIATRFTDSTLQVSAADYSSLDIPLVTANNANRQVTIWEDRCNANVVSAEASEWFSQLLDTDCDLVTMQQSEKRLVNPKYTSRPQTVGFADGFPLLILSLSSIELLNNKLKDPVNINRFRANIIVEGCAPHAEDHWSSISVNNIDIILAKACSRCIIPSIHQHSAVKHPTLLKTLAKYRRSDGKIMMGQNGLHQSNGKINVGDKVLITEK